MNQTLDEILLHYGLLDDTLSTSEALNLIMKAQEKKELEKKYKDKIKKRKDGRAIYVLLPGSKMVSAQTENQLYEKLLVLEHNQTAHYLKDLYPTWLIWKRDNTAAAEKTLREYTFLWNKYLAGREITEKDIKTLSSKDWMAYFRSITKDREITRKKFNNLKSLLNGIYSFAIEEEYINSNPIRDCNVKDLPFKPAKNASNDVFTIKERSILMEYLKNKTDIYSLAIQLDFCLVCRIGELAALKWENIVDDKIYINEQQIIQTSMDDNLNFSSRTFKTTDHIKGWSEKGFRSQPLIPKAREILNKIRKLNPDGEYILMKNGNQILTDTFNEHLRKHCNAAGIPYHSSHKIRFCTASMLYKNGMPLQEIQRLLGHTTLSMTMHYLRIVDDSNTKDIMCNALNL